MVDRVAAMLNYFLCHLVGPKKKNFKVSKITFILFLIVRFIVNMGLELKLLKNVENSLSELLQLLYF